MWLREFMLPFQNPSKRLNKGWEMICSLEKCSISKRMLNSLFKPRSVSAVSFVIFLSSPLSQLQWTLRKSISYFSLPPRNATQLITLSHNPRMSARRPGARGTHWHRQNGNTEDVKRHIICEDYLRRVNLIKAAAKTLKCKSVLVIVRFNDDSSSYWPSLIKSSQLDHTMTYTFGGQGFTKVFHASCLLLLAKMVRFSDVFRLLVCHLCCTKTTKDNCCAGTMKKRWTVYPPPPCPVWPHWQAEVCLNVFMMADRKKKRTVVR